MTEFQGPLLVSPKSLQDHAARMGLSWRSARAAAWEPAIDNRAEVRAGPYAELAGVVTWTAGDSVWLRLDGDAVDLRFRRADVGPVEGDA